METQSLAQSLDLAAALPAALAILAGGAVGVLAGLVYFAALRRSALGWAQGGSGGRVALGALARVAAAVALFAGLGATLGAGAAIAGLAGFTLARSRALSVRAGVGDGGRGHGR